MKSIAILQARMGSDRLPGKSMMTIGGLPLIGYLIETVKRYLPAEQIWMATSERQENDPIRNYSAEAGIRCLSGSEENVASRYGEILQAEPDATYFFRICGDTPYYGGELLQMGLERIQSSPYDFVSSMPNRGYPMGCNLELFNSRFYLDHLMAFSTNAHREHVTGYFYENPNRYHSTLISCMMEGYRYSDTKFSVDTRDDFLLAEKMLSAMNYKPWEFTIPEKIALQKELLSRG